MGVAALFGIRARKLGGCIGEQAVRQVEVFVLGFWEAMGEMINESILDGCITR